MTLYEQRYRQFLRLAEAIVGDVELAHDVVQEAFARAIRSRGTFRGEGSVEGWVWRTVVNAARNARRDRSQLHLSWHEMRDAGSALAALGHNPFDGLTSWLGGSPGKPAPAAEQAGFAARNDASYAGFPKGTKLRLLLRISVNGRPYSLLGFRNGPALCLRLARADEPASLGVNQCVPLRELRSSAAPALVASTAHFGVGAHAVDGVFGLADDTVRTVEIRRFQGDREHAAVGSNAFIALHVGARAGYDPIARIAARTRNGRLVTVPFAPAYGVQAPNGVPSYLRPTALHLRGPAKPETAAPGSISWLAKREARGSTYAPDPRFLAYLDGSVVFSRSIEPNRSDPYRMGVSLIRLGRHPQPVVTSLSIRTIHVRPGELLLCLSEVYPLRGKPVGSLCGESSRSGWPLHTSQALTTRYLYREVFTRVSGLVADDVKKLDLTLLSGRVVPVPIRDNVYTVEAQSAEFPAKLVAYDDRQRVLGVQVVPTHYRLALAPCPRARVAGSAPATRPYARFDPANGDVNGQPILGRTLAEVEAALGQPDSSTQDDLTLYYGRARSNKAALTVYLHRDGQTLRAFQFEYRTPSLAVARLGRVLRLQPAEFQRRMASVYGSSYGLRVAYGSEPNRLGCSGTFQARDKALVLMFGVDPTRSAQPYLILRQPY